MLSNYYKNNYMITTNLLGIAHTDNLQSCICIYNYYILYIMYNIHFNYSGYMCGKIKHSN